MAADPESRIRQIQWYQDWELLPGIRTGGFNLVEERSVHFEIPEDLTGKRILDVGCAEGYYSFLAESRGASVVSIDACPRSGYFLAHQLLNSHARFRHLSVYEIDPEELGYFDLVFCFGVYYHLRHPLLALEKIAAVTSGEAIIETEIIAPHPGGLEAALTRVGGLTNHRYGDDVPLARFCLRDWAGDDTTWWVPNRACLLETVEAAGFPFVEWTTSYRNSRGVLKARKGPETARRSTGEDLLIHVDPLREISSSGTIEITGYAFDQRRPQEPIDGILCYDGTLDRPDALIAEGETRLPRPDLASYFGEVYQGSGYRIRIRPADLDPTPTSNRQLHLLVLKEKRWRKRSIAPLPGWSRNRQE